MKSLRESILNIDTVTVNKETEEAQRIINGICEILKKHYGDVTEGFTKNLKVVMKHQYGGSKIAMMKLDLSGGRWSRTISRANEDMLPVFGRFINDMNKFLGTKTCRLTGGTDLYYVVFDHEVFKNTIGDSKCEFKYVRGSNKFATYPKLILPLFFVSKLTE